MKRRQLAAGLAAAVLGLAGPARAQEMSFSLSAGAFFATDAAYRQVYGGAGLALEGNIWFKLKGPLGAAVGFGLSAADGSAVPMDGGEEEYPVEFRRTSVPLVVFYQVEGKAVDVRFGAGLGIHSYRESWETVDLVHEGHKISYRLMLAVTYALLDRLSLLCSLSYDSIRTGVGSPLAENADVGGVQLLGGLSLRIF